MSEDEHAKTIRAMALERFPREYLGLHGWKAYEGPMLMMLTPSSDSVIDATRALRFLFTDGFAMRGAAYPPQLWGGGNTHLWPVSGAAPDEN